MDRRTIKRSKSKKVLEEMKELEAKRKEIERKYSGDYKKMKVKDFDKDDIAMMREIEEKLGQNGGGKKRKSSSKSKRRIKSKTQKLKTLRARKKTLEKDFKELKDTYQTGDINSTKKERFRHRVGSKKSHRETVGYAMDRMEKRNKIRKEYKNVNKKIKELK